MIQSWIETIISYKTHLWKSIIIERFAKSFGIGASICYILNIIITAIIASVNSNLSDNAIIAQFAIICILNILAIFYTSFYGFKTYSLLKNIRATLQLKDSISLRSLEGLIKKTILLLLTATIGLAFYIAITFYQALQYYHLYDTLNGTLSLWVLFYGAALILAPFWQVGYYFYYLKKVEGIRESTIPSSKSEKSKAMEKSKENPSIEEQTKQEQEL